MRPFSVAVFGCTGNAGRATSLFAIKFAKGRKVALAGRNESKVIALKNSVCEELGQSSKDVGVIVADAKDDKSMLAMASAATVVIACAGPYQRYGEAAVVACIKGGAHYVDITGEAPWVNQMTNKYGEAAKEAGISLLSFSGYDCVPAELAMYFSAQALEGHGGMASLDMVFANNGGGFPKGTLNTILDGLDGKGRVKTSAVDSPVVPHQFKSVQRNAVAARRWLLPQWSHTREWTVQNFMSAINTVVLCRSASDLGYEPFRMNDRLRLVPSSGLLVPLLTLGGLLPCLGYQVTCMMGLLLLVPLFRSWFKRLIHNYSYGGDASASIACDARGRSKDGSAQADVRLACAGDAGIYATGRFAAVVAWTLVDNATAMASNAPTGAELQNQPQAEANVRTGFHSPVAALHASPLFLANLEAAGVDIKVRRKVKGGHTEDVIISHL